MKIKFIIILLRMKMYVNLTPPYPASFSSVYVENKFSTPLVFDKPHEVAVIEASVSHILNTPKDRSFVIRSQDESLPRATILIAKTRWNNVTELVNEIAKQIEKTPFNQLLIVSLRNPRVYPEQDTIQWSFSRNIEVYFPPELKFWLGFQANISTSGPGPGSARAPNLILTKPNFQRGFSRVFLLCDSIFPSEYIWNGFHRKIGSIPVKYEIFNGFSTTNPIYHPLSTTKLEKIEILFTDEYGRSLTLENGRVFVLIHIRPIANYN